MRAMHRRTSRATVARMRLPRHEGRVADDAVMIALGSVRPARRLEPGPRCVFVEKHLAEARSGKDMLCFSSCGLSSQLEVGTNTRMSSRPILVPQ